MNRRIISALMVICLSAGLFQGCRVGNTEYVWDTRMKSNDFVFTINESGCKETEARLYLCNYKNLYGKDYGIDLWKYDFKGASLEEYVKDITLDELVRVHTMNLIAQEQQMELDDDEKKKVKSAAEEYYESLSKDERDFIGANKAEIEEIYHHYALAMKLYNSLTEGMNEEVSDDDARIVRLQQIFVKDKKEADAVAKQLAAKNEFETVANTYNKAEGTEITVARGELPKEVEKVVFEMENDEISKCIKTSEGYYFIKCISKNEIELTEANKEVIKVEREEEKFNEVYDMFYKDSLYYLNDSIWARVKVDKDIEITTDSFFDVYDKYFE